MNIYILPQVDKPVQVVYENDVKLEEDDNGNFTITRKMTPSEIAELFNVPVSDILSGDLKFGIYTLEEEDEQRQNY